MYLLELVIIIIVVFVIFPGFCLNKIMSRSLIVPVSLRNLHDKSTRVVQNFEGIIFMKNLQYI